MCYICLWSLPVRNTGNFSYLQVRCSLESKLYIYSPNFWHPFDRSVRLVGQSENAMIVKAFSSALNDLSGLIYSISTRLVPSHFSLVFGRVRELVTSDNCNTEVPWAIKANQSLLRSYSSWSSPSKKSHYCATEKQLHRVYWEWLRAKIFSPKTSLPSLPVSTFPKLENVFKFTTDHKIDSHFLTSN